MKTNLLILAITSGVLLMQACSTETSGTLADEDRAAITKQHKTATDPAEADPMHIDWKVFTEAHYSDDAVLLPPNGPEVAGKDAIVDYMSTWPSLTKFDVEDVQMEGTKEVTYIKYTYEMGMQINDSTEYRETGKGIELWKQYADGSWKCFMDIWSSDMPIQ
jgi:ketosteroid isomerase-like protein